MKNLLLKYLVLPTYIIVSCMIFLVIHKSTTLRVLLFES